MTKNASNNLLKIHTNSLIIFPPLLLPVYLTVYLLFRPSVRLSLK